MDPNVRIDLGGIAKGFAVDLAIEKAVQSGVENILVTAGGDSRILGDRAGRPWVIGIRHPMDKNRVIAKLPLADESLSTSGDYERYFDEDGVRYHHILDPKTGDSARDVRSVTILGPQAMDTDALSTSVFVMGPKKGLELLDRLPGIEGIIVDQNGNLLFSGGLQNLR
jgi:thiamine biosynthesis lipoprotein